VTPDELADRFAVRFGSTPDGVWRAPGRVNLIGEHTDYNDGYALPFAIQLEMRVAARQRGDDVVSCSSVEMGDGPVVRISELSRSSARGWWSYVHGVVKEVALDTGSETGVDLLLSSTVPVGAGLSSSAALECAVAVAMRDLSSAELSPSELALVAQRAEAEYAGVPCGVMDQMAAMFGREGSALLLDARTLAVDPVPFPPPEIRAIVIDTRTPRTLAAGAYAERRSACEVGARLLSARALRDVTLEQLERARPRLEEVVYRRARHVVTENQRVLDAAKALRSADLDRLADAMAASHRSLREDFEVSTLELDLAVEAAAHGGAVGARMTGGGFGGSAIALVPADHVGDVEDAVVRAFHDENLRAPLVIEVHTADGAARLDM
jgi:galactokinase